MQITKFTNSHVDDLVLLNNELQGTHAWKKQAFLSALAENNCHLCLVDNDELIGFVICPYVFDEAEIHLIGIAKKHHQKGFASHLLTQLFSQLVQQGIQKVHLEVRASNTAAIGLYQKHGFEQNAIRKFYYKTENGKENALIFIKHLHG